MLRVEEIGVSEENGVGKCHIYYVVVSKTVCRVRFRIRQRREMFKNATVEIAGFKSLIRLQILCLN